MVKNPLLLMALNRQYTVESSLMRLGKLPISCVNEIDGKITPLQHKKPMATYMQIDFFCLKNIYYVSECVPYFLF